MSGYVGNQSSNASINPGSLPASRPNFSLTNPILTRVREDAASDRYTQDPTVGRFVAQSVDNIRNFVGIGIVFRSPTGAMRQVRLPARPGDLTLVVLFGTPPSTTPATPPPGASATLRHELLSGGLGCAAAVIGWIGLVAGAFVSGPVGWFAIGLVAFDATASGAASVSCLESGVRVLNETRKRHDLNEKMDQNPAYAFSSRAQDIVGVASVPRAAVTSARAVVEATKTAAAASRAASGLAAGARVIREVILDKDVRIELLNAVGAGIGLAGSVVGGVVAEAASSLPPFPTFTIALSN